MHRGNGGARVGGQDGLPTGFPQLLLAPAPSVKWGCNPGSMSDQRLTSTKRWLGRRRSQRIEFTVPVVIHRPPTEGPQFYESTQTLVVNAHGALMALVEKVTPKQRLLMQNIDSREQKECREVYVEKELTGPSKVAVEFTRPAPSFWRIAYPPADWTAST